MSELITWCRDTGKTVRPGARPAAVRLTPKLTPTRLLPVRVDGQRRSGLLRDRDFRLLWIGETTSRFGSAVTSVALPLVAVITLHASTFEVAALTSAAWLPWLLVGLPAGAWVDRFPRRPVMLASDAVSALAFASVPLAAALGLLTVGQLFVVAAVGGTASVFFSTAYFVFLPSIVNRDSLVEGNAKLQGSESAAGIAGPGLAGVVAQVFGAALGLLADAVSFVVSAACLLMIRSREAQPAEPKRGTTLRREIAAGLRFVGNDRVLLVFTISGAIANLTETAYSSIEIPFLVRTVGLNSGTVGALLIAAGVGGVLGALIAGRVARRVGTARASVFSIAFTAPFALLIPLTGPGPRLVLFVVGLLLPSVGLLVYNVVVSSFRQVYCPPELLGRVAATMRFVLFGTIPLGGLLGGILGTAIGLRPALWILTCAGLLPAMVLVASPLRHLRNLPTEPQSSSAACA